MKRSSQSAADLVRVLASLAERLAAQNLVVGTLHCDWSAFGSWILEVQRGEAADAYGEALLQKEWDTWGPEVVRFTWDGREGDLIVDKSPTPPLSAPNRWKRQMERAFDCRERAIEFVEEYLRELLDGTR